MLVDLGCVFIGHGLNKDLRIISEPPLHLFRFECGTNSHSSRLTDIYIPPSQIIDTVNIYHLASRQRKLSLRFLAYAVLHSAIQADTHDSIEDARTALQLYEEYNRLEAEGSWEDVLEEVYTQGKQTVSHNFSRSKLTLSPRSSFSLPQNFKVPTPDPPPTARIETPAFSLGALGPLPNQQSMFMRNGGSTQNGRRGFMG